MERFFQAFFAVYKDIRSIGGARIAAIGPGTEAKLREYGLAVDIMPKKYVAEGLVKAFKDAREEIGTIEHSTFLWVRGEDARRVIYDGLISMGAIVDECVAYKTEPETDDVAGAQAVFRETGADIVTFTSSSTAEKFLQARTALAGRVQGGQHRPRDYGYFKGTGTSPCHQGQGA